MILITKEGFTMSRLDSFDNSANGEYGNCVGEYRRSTWSFCVFLIYIVLPFIMFASLTWCMFYIAVVGRQWEVINFVLFLFFGAFAVFFGWNIYRRLLGVYRVAIFENGLLLERYSGIAFIPWGEIQDISCTRIHFSINLIWISWDSLHIRTPEGKVSIDSGSGFTFSKKSHMCQMISVRSGKPIEG